MKKEMMEKLELAARIAFFVFALSFGMVVLMAGTKAALAATLRPESVITGDYIKLGDIFEGTKNADYVLGPAPQPGKDMILNARTLYKIASALDVEWRPGSSAEQIILRREASVVPLSDITAALEKKLKTDGITDKFSLNYTNAPSDIVLPATSDATVEVTAFRFDPDKDTFNAVLVAPSADNPLKRVSVSGRVERMASVPVLKSSLRNGDIISSLDLDWIDMPQSKVTTNMLVNEKDIVNMTPRRVASPGKPIYVNDLAQPTMVDRGDAVTLIFENGPMVLTAKGKALQVGAMGDMIHVTNMDSNKTLQGIVTASREVTIR